MSAGCILWAGYSRLYKEVLMKKSYIRPCCFSMYYLSFFHPDNNGNIITA